MERNNEKWPRESTSPQEGQLRLQQVPLSSCLEALDIWQKASEQIVTAFPTSALSRHLFSFCTFEDVGLSAESKEGAGSEVL